MQKSLSGFLSLFRYLLLLTTIISFPLSITAQQKVLIIGIDGCRPDALQTAYTPNIDSLISESTYSYDALTEPPTWSGVGWSGMLTGVWRNKHGVSDNSFFGSNFGSYPHFMKRVEDFDSSLYTVSICNWSPVNSQIVGSTPLNVISNPSNDSLVGATAVSILNNTDPDVIFLHFDDVDHEGHAHGFSPTVPEYMSAIEASDRHIGYIMNALKSRANYTMEDWLVIVSTDHGGIGSSHGGSSFEERNIFYIAHKKGHPPTKISRTTVISNSNCLLDSMGLNMNGNNDYASVSNNNVFQFGANQDFTLELRIKTSGWSGDPAFLGNKNWSSGYNNGFIISSPTNNQSVWKVNIGDGFNRADISGSSINDNLWHHLAATFDRDALLQLYKDGIPDGNVNISSIGDIDNSYGLGIGQDGTLSYGSGMNGLIKEVRIWQTVIDSSTLNQWQCTPINSSHPYYSDLIGYWKMTEGTGNTLFDSSPNGLNATYNGSNTDWEMINIPDTSYDYSNTPRVVDIATTALSHLCIPIDPSWDLDGQTIAMSTTSLQINGNNISCENMQQNYTTTGSGMQNVSWSISNGTIVQGQDSTTVTVQWDSAGIGVLYINQCNYYDSLIVTINTCTNLITPTSDPNVILFPNPTTNTFKISGFKSNFIVNIYSSTGQHINKYTNPKKISLFNEPNGVYIIHISDGKNSFFKKIIKQSN
ncbi:MAG: alkaline phosphatase family protein [Saprospiraceae bacterium]|nr:alkaline phosphatase family protein [Saprospiraceae bacterium]